MADHLFKNIDEWLVIWKEFCEHPENIENVKKVYDFRFEVNDPNIFLSPSNDVIDVDALFPKYNNA